MPEETITNGGVLTLGEVSRRLDVPSHRVKYAIDQHGIRPAMRVGIIRVWAEEDIPRIKQAVELVAPNRRKKHDCGTN